MIGCNLGVLDHVYNYMLKVMPQLIPSWRQFESDVVSSEAMRLVP